MTLMSGVRIKDTNTKSDKDDLLDCEEGLLITRMSDGCSNGTTLTSI